MTPQIELDKWSKEALKDAQNLEDFVFHWFNGQWPDLMGECIAAYNTMNYHKLEGNNQ